MTQQPPSEQFASALETLVAAVAFYDRRISDPFNYLTEARRMLELAESHYLSAELPEASQAAFDVLIQLSGFLVAVRKRPKS